MSAEHNQVKDYINEHYVRKCADKHSMTFCNRRVILIYPIRVELYDISEYAVGGRSLYNFELHHFEESTYVMVDFFKSRSRHECRFVAKGYTPHIYTLKYPRCGLKWEVLKLSMRRFDGTTAFYEREEEMEANRKKELEKKRMNEFIVRFRDKIRCKEKKCMNEFTARFRDENEYVTHPIEDAEATVNILLILMLLIGIIVIDMRMESLLH